MFVIGVAIGLSLVAAVVFRRSFFVVHEGEVALLTSFGRPVGGDTAKSFGPGLHRKAFWHEVHRAPLREELVTLEWDGSTSVLAHDSTPLGIEATVRVRLVPEKLGTFLFGTDHAREHVAEMLECVVRGEVAHFAPEPSDLTAFSRLRRDRRQLVSVMERSCASTLADHYGLEFRAVDVSGLSPPRELEEALNAVMQAEASARAQLEHALAACEQKRVAAREGVGVAEAKARAVHDEMVTLAGYLSGLKTRGTLSDYVNHRRAEILNQSKTVFVRSDR